MILFRFNRLTPADVERLSTNSVYLDIRTVQLIAPIGSDNTSFLNPGREMITLCK